MKNFLLLIFTFLSINSIYSQATCATADPICVGSVIAPPSGLSNPDFGAIGCNALTTNASWYVFKVGTSGNIDFSLHQGNNAPLYNNNDLNFVFGFQDVAPLIFLIFLWLLLDLYSKYHLFL